MKGLVSIVIPTLDRAHLLRFALKSVLAQTYADLEIVVADDCSMDNTQEVVASYRDPRIVYARPAKRLNMAENFEFGLDQAHGEFLTFLTDDSFMLPECIETAVRAMSAAAVDLVVWKHAGYFDHDWIEPRRRNTLHIPRVSGNVRHLDSNASLRRWFNRLRAVSGEMPRSINSLCHRSIIAAVRQRQDSFFLPPAPDHSSGVAMLLHTSAYALVDLPLVIDGVARESIGPSQSFSLGTSAQAFYRSFGTSDMTQVTFLGLRLTPAIIARSFENACAAHPGECPPIDQGRLVAELIDSVAKLEAYGRDMAEPNEIIERFAMERGLRRIDEIRLERTVARLKWSMVRLARALPVVHYVERLRRLDVVQGSEHGFHDIAGSAQVLRERLPGTAAQIS